MITPTDARCTAAACPKRHARLGAIEFDNPGCDKACEAGWHAYAAKMLPLMIARDTQALKLCRRRCADSAPTRWSRAFAPVVQSARCHTATMHTSKSTAIPGTTSGM